MSGCGVSSGGGSSVVRGRFFSGSASSARSMVLAAFGLVLLVALSFWGVSSTPYASADPSASDLPVSTSIPSVPLSSPSVAVSPAVEASAPALTEGEAQLLAELVLLRESSQQQVAILNAHSGILAQLVSLQAVPDGPVMREAAESLSYWETEDGRSWLFAYLIGIGLVLMVGTAAVVQGFAR